MVFGPSRLAAMLRECANEGAYLGVARREARVWSLVKLDDDDGGGERRKQEEELADRGADKEVPSSGLGHSLLPVTAGWHHKNDGAPSDLPSGCTSNLASRLTAAPVPCNYMTNGAPLRLPSFMPPVQVEIPHNNLSTR